MDNQQLIQSAHSANAGANTWLYGVLVDDKQKCGHLCDVMYNVHEVWLCCSSQLRPVRDAIQLGN